MIQNASSLNVPARTDDDLVIGVNMPITTPDWGAFATWFSAERSNFFKGSV